MIRNLACAVPVCLVAFASSAFADDAVDFATRLIGRPYVWGAEGPHSFDCSGLTQYVYQEFGIELPRRAIDQSKFGSPAGSRLQRGDLLFFSTDTAQSLVTHVGLYEGNGVMIDASRRQGRVRRDHLDESYWVERFMFARRVAPPRHNTEPPTTRSTNRRQATIRVLGRIAGELFKLPREKP